MAIDGHREHGALRERVVDGLRTDIIEGRLAPGAPLRTEEVMERFGVSNSPLREAFAQLAAEGLVDVYRNRGAFVAAMTRDGAADLLGVGEVLWRTVYEWAVPRLGDELPELTRSAERFEERASSGELTAALTEAERFQGLVAENCGSPELLRTIESVGPRLRRLVRLLDDEAQVGGYGTLNAATLEAVRAGDASAAVDALAVFSRQVEKAVGLALADPRAVS